MKPGDIHETIASSTEEPERASARLSASVRSAGDAGLRGEVSLDRRLHRRRALTHVASILTLEPGDVIACGSPAGVGAGRDPQIFLKRGDVVVAMIEDIGSLTNPVR